MTFARRFTAAFTLLSGWVPGLAWAQLSATPYVAESYLYESNVFFLPTSVPAPVGKNGPTLADQVLESRVGVDSSYLWDGQKIYGLAEGRRFDFDHFSFLNHNEATLNGGLAWKASRVVDGTLDYRHERSMVQFTDLIDATQLILQTENNATASVGVLLTPDFRAETRARDRELHSPRPDAPNLSLQEDSIHEALRYLGLANLSAGIDLEYLQGKFSHAPITEAAAPRYYQTTAELAATYLISGLTNLNGNLGFTRRSDDIGNQLSGVTGRLAYKRNLTPKTSLSAQVSRAVNSYVSTAGSEVDTSAQLYATWQATYRIYVNAGYVWTNSKYPNFNLGQKIGDRIDHLQYLNLEMTYQALNWLSIHPYARYQTRNSNSTFFDYNATTFGIEFKASLFNRR